MEGLSAVSPLAIQATILYHNFKDMKKKILVTGLIFLLSALAIFIFLPRKPSRSGLRAGKDYNVILITIDTLRADRLGCYGYTPDITPTINIWAKAGIRFARCIAQTPLTLPSHTTIMTGTIPIFHGVRDNGGFVVPDKLQTLAESFKSAGFKTAAFVSAYVLDARWGLSQGFDYYFDNFDLGRFEKISLGEVQRRAEDTINETLSWLDKNKQDKFFIWIHLYDPHTPYDPPEPYQSQLADRPYAGEIAYTDSQLARLENYLQNNGLKNRLFLIVTSDHGESLGQHGEATHGFFVYQETLHVPLIFVTPFRQFSGKSYSGTVTLADIMPTALELSGVKIPAEVQGQSLVRYFTGQKTTDDRLAYAETYYPRFHYGWSELRSFQNNRYKLILAPVPELYDLVNDPEEEKNLVYTQKKVYEQLLTLSRTFEQKASEKAIQADFSSVDEDTRERLAALGYLGSFVDPAKLKGKKLSDPKDKINIFNEISKARETGLSGNFDQALADLNKILQEEPTISDGFFALGNIYFKAKRFKEAVKAFTQALELKPDDSFAIINVANCYAASGQLEEAENFILEQVRQGFDDPQFYHVLGTLYALRGKYDKAGPYFEECLKKNPRSASAHNALAAICLNRDDLAGAERHLAAARELNPALLNLRYNLAQLREKQNRLDEATELYQQEIADSPNHFKALFNLARLYRLGHREEEELEVLRQALKAEPSFPLTYFYLARIYLNQGRNLNEAISLTRKGLELKPDKKNLPLGYFLLADLYNRLGDYGRSEEYARKGQDLLKSR
ncbi:MAG: sulfatase-like hydrolase/transferase [Acidobacteriota bacterium]|nr:sulfatase-like hydrolase/transferase [Acidobacteriota bacterium]